MTGITKCNMLLTAITSILAAQTILPNELPRRGSLGLGLAPVSAEVVKTNDLKAGEGLAVASVAPDQTADRAQLKVGDVILSINGRSLAPGVANNLVRETATGSTVTFMVKRDGKALTLQTRLTEKPRDPGNANYTVIYSHVESFGKKMRTIITLPKRPGRHPSLFFIQGFSPVSYDFTLEGSKGDVSTLDGPILFEFANQNFVTLRVEKPGVGDSEGGPFADLDYTTELDIYRQALKQLKSIPSADPNNTLIFGHSMGGAFGPMVANEIPVKGIAVYGVAARTWFEYLMDTVRYQGLVAGNTFENADEESRQSARLLAQIFLENKSPAEVKKSHPHLSALADAFFPNGLFNGKSLDFWRQLGQTNFAKYWSKLNAHVLSVRGFSDFVTYDADHKLIADIVNQANPGKGKWVTLPESDHLFHKFATEQASMRSFQRGEFNPAFTKLMMDWIRDVMKSG